MKIPDGTSSSVRYNPPSPNKKNGLTVLGPIANNVLSGGIGESGTVFTLTHLYYFSNGDIDTLYTVVNCNESCWYNDKTMQIYFNGKLIHDFDFRDKDSELIERLLDNNYRPFGDTVVFVIPKVL